jgi:hypothetical protein
VKPPPLPGPRLMPPSVPRLMAPAMPSFIARSAIRVAAGTTDLTICLPSVVQNPSLRYRKEGAPSRKPLFDVVYHGFLAPSASC